jgi:hypothetical protein
MKPLPTVSNATLPTRITVRKACEVVGGDKPIHRSSYYRGVERGDYPKPQHARVNTRELLTALRLRK